MAVRVAFVKMTGMDHEPALADKLRYDGVWWRKLAALGSSYAPEWWKRTSPSLVGAICFALIGGNRRAAIANMARVLDDSSRTPTASALRMFVEFSYCFSETLERFGPRPRPVQVALPRVDTIRDAIKRGQGAIVVTGHFGNWDIAALELLRYDRPTHVVMAHEHNDSTNPYVERMREEIGLRVVYSDRSVLSSLELLQALRRNEIVALQLDRLADSDSAREIEMFGAPVRLPSGPFELARLSGAPVIPVFSPRVGVRQYEIHLGQPRTLARRASSADLEACMTEVALEMERMIRLRPHQWFQFQPFWVADGAGEVQRAASPVRRRQRGITVVKELYARRDAAIRSRTSSRRRSRSS